MSKILLSLIGLITLATAGSNSMLPVNGNVTLSKDQNVVSSSRTHSVITPVIDPPNEAVSRQYLRNALPREKSRTSQTSSLDQEENRIKGNEECLVKWSQSECQDLDWIVTRESGWNQYAKNKNCCGLFQRINKCSEDILSSFDDQLSEGMQYITERYGTAEQAKNFWEKNYWY
jgi:hypothetical protein